MAADDDSRPSPDAQMASVSQVFDLLPSARVSVNAYLRNFDVETYESACDAERGQLRSVGALYVCVRIRDNLDEIARRIDALRDWIERSGSVLFKVRIDLTDTPFSILHGLEFHDPKPVLLFHGWNLKPRHDAFAMAEATFERVRSLFLGSLARYDQEPPWPSAGGTVWDDAAADVLDYFETHLMDGTFISSLPDDIRRRIFALVAPSYSERIEASNEWDDGVAFGPFVAGSRASVDTA